MMRAGSFLRKGPSMLFRGIALVAVETVRGILSTTLQLDARQSELRMDTPLIGHIAELDSMAVVSVLTALEEHYGFIVDDDEVSGDVFETVGSLVSFVSAKAD